MGKKRIARLMCCANLQGVSRRGERETTMHRPKAHPRTDLVNRNFFAEEPDWLWTRDIPAWAVLLFLDVVADVFDRRMMGSRHVELGPAFSRVLSTVEKSMPTSRRR